RCLPGGGRRGSTGRSSYVGRPPLLGSVGEDHVDAGAFRFAPGAFGTVEHGAVALTGFGDAALDLVAGIAGHTAATLERLPGAVGAGIDLATDRADLLANAAQLVLDAAPGAVDGGAGVL